MKGGAIVPDAILEKIKSIGFELESSDITPIKLIDSELSFVSDDKGVTDNVLRSIDTTFHNLKTPFSKLTNAGLKSYPKPVIVYRSKPSHKCICCDPYCSVGCKCPGLMSLHKGRFAKEYGKSERYRAQIIYHTEFKITYLEPETSDNVLLSHFSMALQEISKYFSEASVQQVYLEDYHSKDVHLFKTKDGSDEFMTITDSKPTTQPNTILDLDIRWHAQCTIGVELENIQEVVLFLAANTVYDSTLLQEVHKKYITEHQRQYQNLPSDLENGFYFLTSMFDLKGILGLNKTSNLDTDYRLAVRHPLIKVYNHFKNSMTLIKFDPFDDRHSWEGKFAGVGQLEFNGRVLIEMRDFYDQFLDSFKGWKEKDYPDGQSISFFNEGIEKLVLK